MADFLKSQLDYIFFFYGAAFFLLVPICLFLRQRPNCARIAWIWLAWFGAIHGTNEWLDLLALNLISSHLFNLVKFGVVIISFVCLTEFGRASIVTLRGHGPGRWILAAMAGLAALGGLAGLPGLYASTRLVLGLAGGVWAAWALFVAAKTLPLGARQLQAAGLGMAFYALAAGLVPNPAPFFPPPGLITKFFWTSPGFPSS